MVKIMENPTLPETNKSLAGKSTILMVFTRKDRIFMGNSLVSGRVLKWDDLGGVFSKNHHPYFWFNLTASQILVLKPGTYQGKNHRPDSTHHDSDSTFPPLFADPWCLLLVDGGRFVA